MSIRIRMHDRRRSLVRAKKRVRAVFECKGRDGEGERMEILQRGVELRVRKGTGEGVSERVRGYIGGGVIALFYTILDHFIFMQLSREPRTLL